jgi:hypothetical protein
MAITYRDVSTLGRTMIDVRLDGKLVGTIHQYGDSFAYKPKSGKRGEEFPTLAACKRSLEEPESDQPNLTYEQIKAKQDADRLMHQWWTLLSEKERGDIVKGIKGCHDYGATIMVQRMPEAGQNAVREAYAEHMVRVAELEAKYPSA